MALKSAPPGSSADSTQSRTVADRKVSVTVACRNACRTVAPRSVSSIVLMWPDTTPALATNEYVRPITPVGDSVVTCATEFTPRR